MSADVETQVTAESFATSPEPEDVAEIVQNEKKRPRSHDDGQDHAVSDEASAPKKPKLAESEECPPTPAVDASAEAGGVPVTSPTLYPFEVEKESSDAYLLRFELKASDIVLAKRLACENAVLFSEDYTCTGWKKNDHFIFCPQEDPSDPEENAPLATSAHPLEQAWMTQHGIREGSVWHDTSKLCPTTSVFLLLTPCLAVQVRVVDGPVTLNMLVQAVERALDTPLSHPKLSGVHLGAKEEKLATIGHLLRDRLIFVTDNLTADPGERYDIAFSRADETARILDVTAL